MSDEWNKGYPEKHGLYMCRIDGEEETVLHHHVCQLNGRHWWTNTAGGDVVAQVIEWKKEKIKI